MKLRIIKPPKRGNCFATLNSDGYLFFSVRAIDEMNIRANRKIIVAHDEFGNLYVKTICESSPEWFDVYVRKNGNCSIYCIRITHLLRNFGACVKKLLGTILLKRKRIFGRLKV